MTREEAVKMLEAKLECMTRNVSGIDYDCNRRLCRECHLNYDQGNMGEQKEYLRMSIEALKQGSILDKIRAEIVDLGQRTMNDNRASGIWACRDIIDKYRAESEE